MRVIVDTCVWSLSLRRRTAARISTEEKHLLGQLREAIQDRRVVMIGPIRQEILSGIKDRAQFAKTEELLDPFCNEAIVDGDYVEAARLFNLCRAHGVQCGPVDMLICAVAVRGPYRILTNDQGLLNCVEVLKAEGLTR